MEPITKGANVAYSVKVVYVGSAGHLKRYKVLDERGNYVPGGLFRSFAAAQAFISDRKENR